MSYVNNENYILVPGWAVTELKLKNTELLVFSIIYGFSQDGENKFKGSRQYLIDWTNSSPSTIQRALESLLERHLIIKTENYINNVKLCDYQVDMGMVKMNMGYGQNDTGGMVKMTHHNIDIYSKDNIDKEKLNKKKSFEPPTVEDIKAYCKERNNRVDAELFFDYYESNGWMVGKNHMKDWKASVRTWERNNNGQPKRNNERNDKVYKGGDILAEFEALGIKV